MKIVTKLFLTAGVFAALLAVHLWQADQSLRRQRDALLAREAGQAHEARLVETAAQALAQLEAVLSEPEPSASQWPDHLERGRAAVVAFEQAALRVIEAPRLASEAKPLGPIATRLTQNWRHYESLSPDPQAAAAAAAYRLRHLLPTLANDTVALLPRLTRAARQAVTADHVAAVALMEANRRQQLLRLSLLLLAIGGAGFFWHRSLIRPLREMERDAEAIGSGQRDNVRLSYLRDDELGSISHAFNSALDHLKASTVSRAELQRLVDRRSTELVESNARAQRVIESGGQGYWEWDLANGDVVFRGNWNALFGHRLDEIEHSYTAWVAMIHPDDRAHVRTTVQQHIGSRSPAYEVEHRMRTADGRWKWVLTRGLTVARNADGFPTLLAGTHTDIDARKTAEEELRVREAQLRQLADNLPEVGLYQFVVTRDGLMRNTYVGEGLKRVLGVDASDLAADPGWIARHTVPEDQPALLAANAVALRDRAPLRHEARIRTATGEVKWLSFRSHPREGFGGETVWDGVMIDITARKAAESSLAQQADFLAALNETTLDLLNRREKEPLLQTIVERTARLLDVPHAELALLEDNELVTRAYVGPFQQTLGDRATREVAPMSWRALDSGAPVLVDDYPSAEGRRPFYVDMGSRAAAVFPILHGERRLGVLGLVRHQPGQVFNLDDLQKGQLLAQLVALVLHNSAIYEDAVRVAETRTKDLRDNEWRLREAQRIAHIGHWEYPFVAGNNVERWSDETYRIFGLAPQSIPIRRAEFDRLVHPDDLPAVRRQIEEVWAAPRRVVLDYRIVRPDGTVRHIHDEGEPKLDADGRIIGMQGIVQDVTERAHADAALREREQLYRNLVETIDHGYYITNARSAITYVSPAMEALGGFGRGELLGRSSFRHVAEEDRPRVMDNYRRWRDDSTVRNIRSEFRVVAKNGRRFWVEQSTHFVRDADGRVAEARNVLRDITERRAAEEALREREERFRSVFDHSPIPIVLSRLPGGEIVAANAAAERAFGYTVAECLGRTTMELGIWEDAAERTALLQHLERHGAVTGHEVRLRNRSGQTLRLLFSVSRIRLGDQPYALSSLLDVTAQKRTEDSLRESELRFKRVVENIGDALVVDDAEGKIVFANDRFLEMFRLARKDLAGLTIAGLMAPEDREAARAVHEARLTAADAPTLFEAEAVRTDGSRFWIELRVTPVAENGRIIGRQAALRDITERRLIDRTLRLLSTGTAQLSGARFYDFVALRLAEILGLDGCLIAARGSDGWRTLALRLDGKTGELRAPDACPGTLTQAVLDERIMLFAASVPRAFPQDRWLAELGIVGCAAAPLLGGNGEVIGFVALLNRHQIAHLPQVDAVLQLAAVRLAAELARGRNERQFQDLFEFAPDTIVLVDPAGHIVRTNHRVETLFGCSAESLVGAPLSVLIPEAGRTVAPRLQAAFLDARRHLDTRTQLTELEARRSDGSPFPVAVSLGAVETENGVLIAAAIRDITEQRLAEARFRQTQKMEALGTLAGGIAHDFNNILTGMFGFVELSRAELPASHPAQPWLDNIGIAARRARNLVQQILTFSRQNEGERAPVDVGSVVGEALRLLRSTLPSMVRIEERLAPDPPRVLADATQLHQVVMNLCTNAWHALPDTGGLIRITVEGTFVSDAFAAAHAGMPRGRAVRLAIADNGCGMDQAVLERVFDPFFTTKPAGQGTGLGLAVVHGVVRAHGGGITVRSAPGEGTEFEIVLPAVDTDIPVPAPAPAIPRGQGQRILLIDDEPLGRAALAALLQHLGYRVDHFAQPQVALTHFASEASTFALVLTDFAMPELTGVAVTRQIRAIRPDIPVILISGFIDPARQAEIDRVEVTLVMRKPPTMEEVAHALAKCLAAPAAP